jgi:serine/threonine-protein kinase
MVASYELLGELGHGGMGVVYKARHIRLDRFVALKMVLAGAHASPVQLARFLSESQAIARLQHPNIVQLYEVGEHEGLPFLALEFVDGDSLAQKTGGRPMPPREAAQLIAILAGAMDYAHRNGVIHRDLKPANILLTADGVPKVVDFGLAKRLEVESAHTRTGTLMGTPSYMAPEQARGDNQGIGPHTDVYALGAVLYELLTGRPPFLAANAMETVLAVLNSEAVAPSRIQPRTPRDLETICLKCLQKEPGQRYASAAALADDLYRQVAGEPIRARPVGPAERLVRWARRHPGVAALTAAVMVLLTTVAVVSMIAAVAIREGKLAAEQNAETARVAQKQAEDARAEAERQKGAAERSAAAALAARKRADENARTAEDQRELALDALGSLVTKVQDQLSDAPDTQQIKKELLEDALAGLRKVAATGDQAALVDIRSAEAHRRLGLLFTRLGDLPSARREYEEVYRIVKANADADPANPDWKRNLSVAVSKLGDLAVIVGDTAGARKWYGECLAHRTELTRVTGDSAKSLVDLAQVYLMLGGVSGPGDAQDYLSRSLEIRSGILEADRKSAAAWRDVWISHLRLAEWHLKQGNPAAARTHVGECLTIARLLTKSTKKDAVRLALSHARSGDVYRAEKKPEEAQRDYAEAVRLVKPEAEKNQKDAELQITYAVFLAHAGDHREAADLARSIRGTASANAYLLYNVACVYSLCAEAAGDRAIAAGYVRSAHDALRAALAAGYVGYEQIRTDPDLAAARSAPGFREVEKRLR